jgi:hypothetical protein
MQKPSKAGVVVLCLFGTPFAAMGLFFAVVSGMSNANGAADAWIGILFGAAFSCIGFGLMAAGILGYGRLKRQKALEDANPQTPWMWKPDWAAGRADGSNSRSNVLAWVFAALWNLISVPIAVSFLPKALAQNDLRGLLVAFFPLVGFGIAVYAVHATLRTMRYGRTSFCFEGATFSPGSKLKGSIHLRLPADTPHGFDLTLSCTRRIETGSGKNRHVEEFALWQEQKRVAPESVLRGPNDAQVPVEFAVPGDAFETNDDNANDRVFWRLHAQADVPGVDFSDNYEVPVFRTQASEAQRVSGPDAAAAVEEGPIAAPDSTHIVYRADWDGPGFYFPPLRNHAQALGVVFFAAIWSAVVYFLWKDARAPWVFRIVFSLAELLVGYMLLTVVFGSAMLRVRGGVLEVRKSVLGIGSVRTVAFDDVSSIAPVSQGQASPSGQVLFGIRIARNAGGDINIAANSLTDAEARWVVATIEAAMGRKQDTRLQFSSSFGAPPQGPVWGGSGSKAAAVAMPATTRRTQRLIAVAGFAIWLLFAGQVFRTFFRDADRSGAFGAGSGRQTAGARPIPADFSRIGTLPAQRQSEDLLELSVRHDERALAMFESKIDSWTGTLQLTDRMKQLEAQSRFSTDLRVREANADLNLAIAGLHRDSGTVESLMQRAEADASARPQAYYYLGMEGGRGVDSERVFAFLSDRAQHDPDAVARQWAVEGLRFFKSDKALDLMYSAFTSDPSLTVRDRAGCNLSDCGIFTRAQRIQYLPKLVELSGDPALSPQMRTWVFMALRGITDESIADDARAWREWNELHGAERARQFAALPWYEVKGDQ